MEPSLNMRQEPSGAETLDFGKLLLILRNSWRGVVLIFIIINLLAYLFVRYTKNVYKSESEIKLDIKRDATGLGIKNMVEDPDVNIISGEIEIIQSKLFLNRVIDETDFVINFISVGRLLNNEMFQNSPATVHVYNSKHSLYNTPITFAENGHNQFVLTIGANHVTGTYGERIQIGDLHLRLDKNRNFQKGDEVGYYFIINSREVLLNYLLTNLVAEPLNWNANTIRLSFKDHNPYKAQAVLSKIDTIYLHYSNEQKNLANKQKIDWLANELSHIEKRMEDYENYFENFTLENKTNDLDEDLKNTINAINRVDSQRYEHVRTLAEMSRMTTDFEAGKYVVPASVRRQLPPVVIKNIEDLNLLQLQQEKLRLSYSEITYAFREKEKEIGSLKQKTLDQINELRKDWTSRLKELNAQKETLEKEFAAYPEKNTEFSKNQRFYKLYEEFYLTLMQSKSEFEIAQAGTTPDFKILSPASLVTDPISPNRPMIAGIGLVMSIIANLLFIGFLYLINNKITSLAELERVKSAPVLGSVPASRYNETNIHIIDHPKSMVSEAMRSIRTNLDFFNISSREKVIAISSTVSGEGKSFIAMNLGGVLALSKKRVLLIDLDMRKSKENQPVTIDNTRGISTILIRKHHWSDCVANTGVDNFDFIPSGPHPPNPSELLLNGEFSELLAELREHYDYILLDTPPVGLVTDGIMAMRRADLSIYVFRTNYSKREFLSSFQRIINLNKFSNITTLLNAVPASGRTYGYGYYEESPRPKGKIRTLLKV